MSEPAASVQEYSFGMPGLHIVQIDRGLFSF